MPAIPQPGVTVNQEFTSTSISVATPNLMPVLVGPCYHVVDAVETDSTFNADALAGSYQSNIGSQSFSFPGLSGYEGGVLDTDSVKVYLDKLNGTPQAALRSVDDESVLVAYADGELVANNANPYFTSASVADWKSYGITPRSSGVKGDVVRFSHLGRVYDLEVIDLVKADNTSVVDTSEAATKLKLDISHLSIDGTSSVLDVPLYNLSKSSISYNVIDKPADYIVKTSAVNAKSIQIGDGASNYFYFEAIGTMAGSEAESSSFAVVLKSAQIEDGSDGYADGALFIDTAGGLGSAVDGHYVLFDDAAVNGEYAGVGIIADVLGSKVVGLTTSASFSGTSKNARIGAVTTFAAESITFNGSGVASWSLVGYTGTTANAAVRNGSDWHKASISSGVITLDVGASSDLQGGSHNIDAVVVSSIEISGTGSEGADTFASADLTSDTASGDYIVIDGTYSVTASSVADNMVTITGISAKIGVSWVSVPPSETLSASYSASTKQVTINTGRSSGVPSTFTEIINGLTVDHASELDSTVAAILSAVLEAGSGSTALDESAFTAPDGTIGSRTYPLEGGANANQIILDGGMTNGNAVKVYIGYRALRVDLSAAASDPSLLTIESIADAETKLGRTDTVKNPLGLAAKLALTNSVGNTSIKALGLSAQNSAELSTYPEGSPTAYDEALTLLEAEDVYALAPLSSSREVAALFSNHADNMSLPENGGERVAFVAREFPGYSAAKLVINGSAGSTASDFNTSGEFTGGVDFGLDGANFAALEAALDASDEIILVLNSWKTSTYAGRELLGASSEQYGFRVSAIPSGNTYQLTIDTDDIEGVSTNDLSSEDWYLYIQGKAITASADQAERVATFGSEYATRRTYFCWPPKLLASVGSNSELLSGHYIASVVAACVGFQPVGKSFTNLPLSGFTGLRYSNRHFSKSQLDDIAGGGTLIVIQPVEGGPLKIRHQLSTDVSSIQRRELSITKALDYFAKTLRDTLSDQIGGANITTEFVEALGMTVQGIISRMVKRGVTTSANLIKIVQNADNPDTIDIIIDVAPIYPCNYIQITLQV